MPHHGNEAEHSEGNEQRKPVIRDNRKVDPETGAARHPEGEAKAAPTDGDALSQAEEILNGVEVPAEESVAPVLQPRPRQRNSATTSSACRLSTSTTASALNATAP